MTWDGATQRLFVNGTQVATRALAGTLPNSAGALRFGGNGVWSEWFAGSLDEIRVYDRALTQAQLQADMNTPVSCGGSAAAASAGGFPEHHVLHGHSGRRQSGGAELRRDEHGRRHAQLERDRVGLLADR